MISRGGSIYTRLPIISRASHGRPSGEIQIACRAGYPNNLRLFSAIRRPDATDWPRITDNIREFWYFRGLLDTKRHLPFGTQRVGGEHRVDHRIDRDFKRMVMAQRSLARKNFGKRDQLFASYIRQL